MTPLINIVFLILIFFIVAGQFKRPQPFAVDLPLSESHSTVEGGTAGELEIFLGTEGEIAWGMDIVSLEELRERLSHGQDTDSLSSLSVRLLADSTASLGDVHDVLDVLRGAKIRHVRFSVREAPSRIDP